jgi:hypothetical protein
MLRAAAFSALFAMATLDLLTSATAQSQPDARPHPDSARASAIRVVEQIKRADYEGDGAALKRLHDELNPASSTGAVSLSGAEPSTVLTNLPLRKTWKKT